ncbi:MAG TPA: universal stress protein [Angustibacter sp.]|nr:universal stress protein [Angustibacter sp.]
MNETRDVIVVGVDGSPGSARALEWALQEAQRRGWSVEVITAYGHGAPEGNLGETAVARAAREDAEATQAQQITEVAEPFRDAVSLASEVVFGSPVDRLSEASRHAGLLVVGSHGYSRLREVLVGSTAAGCIRRADCPVVVLPAPHVPVPEQAVARPQFEMGPMY